VNEVITVILAPPGFCQPAQEVPSYHANFRRRHKVIERSLRVVERIWPFTKDIVALVRAIQSASPLPAPPDPKVFSPNLTLDFRSQPFSPGMEADGFERVDRTNTN
jgi:hypothetical protein